jgi:hypothetical protein
LCCNHFWLTEEFNTGGFGFFIPTGMCDSTMATAFCDINADPFKYRPTNIAGNVCDGTSPSVLPNTLFCDITRTPGFGAGCFCFDPVLTATLTYDSIKGWWLGSVNCDGITVNIVFETLIFFNGVSVVPNLWIYPDIGASPLCWYGALNGVTYTSLDPLDITFSQVVIQRFCISGAGLNIVQDFRIRE